MFKNKAWPGVRLATSPALTVAAVPPIPENSEYVVPMLESKTVSKKQTKIIKCGNASAVSGFITGLNDVLLFGYNLVQLI